MLFLGIFFPLKGNAPANISCWKALSVINFLSPTADGKVKDGVKWTSKIASVKTFSSSAPALLFLLVIVSSFCFCDSGISFPFPSSLYLSFRKPANLTCWAPLEINSLVIQFAVDLLNNDKTYSSHSDLDSADLEESGLSSALEKLYPYGLVVLATEYKISSISCFMLLSMLTKASGLCNRFEPGVFKWQGTCFRGGPWVSWHPTRPIILALPLSFPL